MHAVRVVGYLDQCLTNVHLGRDPVSMFRRGAILGRGRQKADCVAGHHPVATWCRVEVAVENVDQYRGERHPHADVFDRDKAQASPQVLCHVGRGCVHLICGQDGVVDTTPADVLLQNGDEIVDGNAVWGNDLRVGILAEMARSIATCQAPDSSRSTFRHVRIPEEAYSAGDAITTLRPGSSATSIQDVCASTWEYFSDARTSGDESSFPCVRLAAERRTQARDCPTSVATG